MLGACNACGATAEKKEDATSIQDLPPEIAAHLLTHSGMSDLLSLASSSKGWRDVEVEYEEDVWSQRLAQDIPLLTTDMDFDMEGDDVTFGADTLDMLPYIDRVRIQLHEWKHLFQKRPRPAKLMYQAATLGFKFEVQLFNKNLAIGTFGSAIRMHAYHRLPPTWRKEVEAWLERQPAEARPPEEEWDPSTRVWIDKGTKQRDQPWAVPVGRVRRCFGGTTFEPMASSFADALQPGMVVELQWKARAGYPRYNMWFALVHAVRPGGDEVELCFPQYGRSSSAAKLSHHALIHRLHETPMHGGMGGGIRIPSARETAQWWDTLSTDEHDGDDLSTTDQHHVVYPNEALNRIDRDSRKSEEIDREKLRSLRLRFHEFLPEGQPGLSLRLAAERERTL